MTPMFVETQSSQGPENIAASPSGSLKGQLRATQTSLEFSQTQAAGTYSIYFYMLANTDYIENCINDYCSAPRSTFSIQLADR